MVNESLRNIETTITIYLHMTCQNTKKMGVDAGSHADAGTMWMRDADARTPDTYLFPNV